MKNNLKTLKTDKLNISYVKKKTKNIKLTELKNKKLLTKLVGLEASKISKNKQIESETKTSV